MAHEPFQGPADDPSRVARFRCEQCGTTIRSSRPLRAGKTVRCPTCGSATGVGSPPSEATARLGSAPPTRADSDRFDRSPGASPSREAPARWRDVPGYTILGELGRGATGVVYRARDEKLRRIVALKLLPGDGSGRNRAEAQAVAKLHHPNIVQIFEVGDLDGTPYLALEYVSGGTLQGRIEGGPQPVRASARLVEALARAVHVAHRAGLVHRDLKPANVLLATRGDLGDEPGAERLHFGVPKIADFGLALRLDRDDAWGDGHELAGTPAYMAPEQVRGRVEDVGPGVDIHALGVILYELVAGRRPFQGEGIEGLLRTIQDAPPPPLDRPDCPGLRDLDAICRKAMAKDPRDRYRSASAMADDLARYLRGEPVEARPLGRLERAWRWASLNPTPASLLATASVLVAVGLPAVHVLSGEMVKIAAVRGAEQQARTILELWSLYAMAIDEAKKEIVDSAAKAAGGADPGPKFALTRVVPEGAGPGPSSPDDMAGVDFDLSMNTGDLKSVGRAELMPAPATLVKFLGMKLNYLARADGDAAEDLPTFTVYSDNPFQKRGDLQDEGVVEFGKATLRDFAAQREGSAGPAASERPAAPSPVAEFRGDRLRLGFPIVMRNQTCIDCHNKPGKYDQALYKAIGKEIKTDWKVGDTRGVLVIDRPMRRDYDQASRYLFWVHGGVICASLALLAGARALLGSAGRRVRPAD